MAFGILEPATTMRVSGTVLLDQDAAHSELTTSHLKHGTGKNSHMVLAPPPSNDPNDPLDWSTAQKHTVFLIILFGELVVATLPGPMLNAGLVTISQDLNVSVAKATKLSGYTLIASGCFGPVASALARKFGNRPLYVASSLISLIGCILGQTAQGYSQFAAARVLEGLGISAYEALIISTIGDLYFVHERALKVASVIFLVMSVATGMSIISGLITANLGWHYNFHILLPLSVLQFILVILFVPETTYNRSAIYNMDTSASDQVIEKLGEVEDEQHGHQKIEDEGLATTNAQTVEQVREHAFIEPPPPPRKTILQQMALYNGTFVSDSIFKMLLACIAILLNVAATYSTLMWGTIMTWFLAAAFMVTIMGSALPYSYSSASIGYVAAGPLIGGFLGMVAFSLTATHLTRWLTQKNKGIYEPEFCLAAVVIGAPITIAALVSFGHVLKTGQSIYLVSFIWGLLLFGLTYVTTSVTEYALDAFREYSTEIFIMNMFYKNLFAYGFTNFIVDWFINKGVENIFNVTAGIRQV